MHRLFEITRPILKYKFSDNPSGKFIITVSFNWNYQHLKKSSAPILFPSSRFYCIPNHKLHFTLIYNSYAPLIHLLRGRKNPSRLDYLQLANVYHLLRFSFLRGKIERSEKKVEWHRGRAGERGFIRDRKWV